jgi:glutamyl-tRNA reductase
MAESSGATGKILNQMFQRAFKIGKQVHTETSLHRGAVSISSAAVEVASQHFGSLTDKTALVIGAGNMARLATEALMKKKPARVIVTNRTRARAEAMIADLKCDCTVEVVDFDDFPSMLPAIDVVISSTSSPLPLINLTHLESQQSPILLIDIAVPRDIAPDVTQNPVVELKNIDDLNEIVDRNHRRRMADLPVVEQMVMKEMSEFLIWYYSQPLLPATIKSGQKPDAETQREIVRVKDFLLANLPSLHRRALKPGGDFRGHLEIVNELSAKHRELSEARVAVGA